MNFDTRVLKLKVFQQPSNIIILASKTHRYNHTLFKLYIRLPEQQFQVEPSNSKRKIRD